MIHLSIPDKQAAAIEELERIVRASRESFATQDYKRRRAAALKGRRAA